jgi:hypothetical protein
MPMIVVIKRRRWWQFAHLMMSEEVSHIGHNRARLYDTIYIQITHQKSF